jgi:hypothetical protein
MNMANDTEARRIKFVPNRLHHKLVIAFAYVNYLCKSEAGMEITKRYFASLKESERAELLRVYDGMSESERKKPKRL